ncbi:hypothetical protein NDA18_001890 [Ustilago nuda]|nr:hypothetical protein NDA18_001890 [Ustilago nuda]
MRIFAILLLVTLCLCPIGQAQPLPKAGRQSGEFSQKGHQACKAVEKQQRIMQERWDEMHPDGFTPAGDQMRPISFDCKTQERHLKPLVSYNNPAELYR